MTDSPPERSPDYLRHSADSSFVCPPFWLIACGLAVAWMTAACDDTPVVEPEPEPITPKVDKLKQRVDSFETRVDEAIDKRGADTELSVDEPTD